MHRCRPSRNPQSPDRSHCNAGQPIVAMRRRAPSQTIVGHLSLHGTGSVSLSSLPLDSPASVVVPGCDPAVTASFWVEPKNENGHRTPLKPTTFYAVFLSIDHTLLIFSNRIPLDSPPPVVVPGWDSTVGAAFWVKPRAATSRTQQQVEVRLHRNLAGRDWILAWEECRPRCNAGGGDATRRRCRKSGQTRTASFSNGPEPGAGRN